MNLIPGTAIFSGDKNIYYVLSIVIFVFGIGFLLSAFFSFFSHDFWIMIILSIILIFLSLILVLIIYKSK